MAKLIPHIKKNAIVLFISAGFFAKAYGSYNQDWTYRYVYSQNDFEREYHLQKLRALVNETRQ